MSDAELEWLATTAGLPSVKNIVEVGSWMGRSTVAMADNTDAYITAVDTWEGSPEHKDILNEHGENWLIERFLLNCRGLMVFPFMSNSAFAAYVFHTKGKKFDFIFLDANHSYDSVKGDIQAYRPLLAEGGIFAGHDFDDNWPGVKKAVTELIPRFRVIEGTSIWMEV